MGCEVQDGNGNVCGQQILARWDWGGGVGLNMCEVHDKAMRRHVARCRDCRKRLKRKGE